jgi:cytochrome c biogenesis factor
MWNFITRSGVATTVSDYTSEFSPLLVCLVSFLWLSVGVIVMMAVRHYHIRKTLLGPLPEATDVDRRKAA